MEEEVVGEGEEEEEEEEAAADEEEEEEEEEFVQLKLPTRRPRDAMRWKRRRKRRNFYKHTKHQVNATRRGQRAIAQHRRAGDPATQLPYTPASNLGVTVLLSPADAGQDESGRRRRRRRRRRRIFQQTWRWV